MEPRPYSFKPVKDEHGKAANPGAMEAIEAAAEDAGLQPERAGDAVEVTGSPQTLAEFIHRSALNPEMSSAYLDVSPEFGACLPPAAK